MLFAFWTLMALWAWHDARQRQGRDRIAVWLGLAVALVAACWQTLAPPVPSLTHAVIALTEAVLARIRLP